jgi:hypothetical protein
MQLKSGKLGAKTLTLYFTSRISRSRRCHASEKFEDFETHFRIKWCYRLVKFHEVPYIAAQLHGVPHGILRVFNTILYEIEFQNPQIFHQHGT